MANRLPNGNSRPLVDEKISLLFDLTFAILDAFTIAPDKLHYRYDPFVTANGDEVSVAINPLDNDQLLVALGSSSVQAVLKRASVSGVTVQHDTTRPRFGRPVSPPSL